MPQINGFIQPVEVVTAGTLPRAGFVQPVEGVAGPGSAISVKGDPGAVITTDPDVVIGTGTTVALGAIPANTRRMRVQNAGPAGTWVRVREVSGTAGSGILLPRLGEVLYGGADGALAQLEVQDVSLAVGGTAVATVIAVQYEGD